MIIVSLIVLLAVFAVMVVGFQKIMNKNVVVATEHLGELAKDYEDKEKSLEQRLEETKQKCLKMLSEAKDEAEQARANIVKEAEGEKIKIIEGARRQSQELIGQAEKSRGLLLAEINDRIAREATDKACELIQDTLSEEVKRQLHQHWAQELIERDFESLTRLRVPEQIREIRVVSAFALSENQIVALSKKLRVVLEKDVVMKQETDDKLVAGIVIYIDSLVLDGSLKSKLQKRSKNY